MNTELKSIFIKLSCDDNVYKITLSRPDKRNAINTEMARQFVAACEDLVRHGAISCIIEAEGGIFSAGADTSDPEMSAAFSSFYDALLTTPVIWIACVSGGAIGAGLAIVAAAQVVVAGPGMWVSLPEIAQIGRFPAGIFSKAERYVDRRWLMRLALSGQAADIGECVQGGLVTDRAEAGREYAKSVEWAKRLSACSHHDVESVRKLWFDRHS